ncbi:MAG TPA: YDG domain-containing protein, partial [Gemmataceae bacterium]|nr:YDG domain-containing protein [Gemmataceae bacterium]
MFSALIAKVLRSINKQSRRTVHRRAPDCMRNSACGRHAVRLCLEALEDRCLLASPVLTWATPPDITYGTPLGSSQLDAAADVPGTFTYAPAAGAVPAAGQAQTLTVTFTPNDTAGYTSATDTVLINVNPAPLTVTGITVNPKVYDGTTVATLNTTNVALAGILAGDTVTLDTAGATAVFNGKDAGNEIVNVSGFTISGPQANNYSLLQPALPLVTITPAPLTVTGITANDKVYDGSTAASLNTSGAALAGVLSGDQVLFSPTPSATLTGIDDPNGIAVDAG